MTKTDITEKQLAALEGRFLLSLVEAGRYLGYKKQTSYNMNSRGVFPVKIKKVNGKPMVRVTDFIEFIEE
jgi:hypothetical protein